MVDGHLVSFKQFSPETKAKMTLFALPGPVTTSYRLPDLVSAPSHRIFALASYVSLLSDTELAHSPDEDARQRSRSRSLVALQVRDAQESVQV